MKKKILYCFLFIGFYSFGQNGVGINTKTPIATLDVEGTLRIGEIPEVESTKRVITVNDQGILNTSVNKRTFTVTKTVPSGGTVIFEPPQMLDGALIAVKSSNGCDTQMITSFVNYLRSMTYISGIARAHLANVTLDPIAISESIYSPKSIVTFPSVETCSSDKGNATQFNFNFQKISATQYELTNKGNVDREFSIVWNEI